MVIKQQSNIKPTDTTLQTQATEIGYVNSINDYLIWIEGLPNIKVNEIILSQNKAKGLVTSIKAGLIEALMLDNIKVKPKESFIRTNIQLSLNAGTHLLGRAINPLGLPIDGKPGFGSLGQAVLINQTPPSINARAAITQQFETGTTLVDLLTPLAFGQRELVIGDAHSGKTGFLLDTIISQKGNDVVCIYALIGKPIVSLRNIMEVLKTNKALDYTTIVATTSSEKATLVYLTPYAAMSLAEFHQRRGKNVLLILDDLGVHAKYYREITLLSGRPPGRDSYPGDIFFQHARLIERAGKFNDKFGGGSITALPIIETHLDDFTSYMTTNLMGMTDGHLLFSSSRFRQGIRPAVDTSLSVSRVGRQTQNLAQKLLADRVKTLMVQATKLESYARLGSEISAQTRFILKQGHQVEEILKQPLLDKIPFTIQMILLGLIFTHFFGEKDIAYVARNKQIIINFLKQKFDYKKYQQVVVKMKDDKEFIASLEKIIPELSKICR